MCEDCIHSFDGYCELFDDVLSFENCIFGEYDLESEE